MKWCEVVWDSMCWCKWCELVWGGVRWCRCANGKATELKPSCVFNGQSSEIGVYSRDASGVGRPNWANQVVQSGVRWCESWCGIVCTGVGRRCMDEGSD